MSRLTEELKTEIDGASYTDLLWRNRFTPIGDEIMSGESGKYFCKVMYEKRAALSPAEQVAASKNVG